MFKKFHGNVGVFLVEIFKLFQNVSLEHLENVSKICNRIFKKDV